MGVAALPTDQLIVSWRGGRASAAARGAVRDAALRAGLTPRWLRAAVGGAEVLKLDRRLGATELTALARLLAAAHGEVVRVEPDRLLQPLYTPNDPQYASQWHYQNTAGGLRLPAAWDLSIGTGVVVAVIDTGYRPHADLAGRIVAGYDMIADSAVANDGGGRDGDPQDPGDWVTSGECGFGSSARNSSWHGTHVAGTVAAATGNGLGVAGVAFGASVQPVRVLGKCGGYDSDIADAIVWASGGSVSGVPANATPAKVINMSLGGQGSCSSVTQNAINSARSRGTVVVVAAGNSSDLASRYTPANCAGVVTVASVGPNGGAAYYTNYGSAVDVAAPGGDQSGGTTSGVLSTWNSGTSTPGADAYAYMQGTSMAAPHVAGVAALMRAANPALTPDDVEARLKSSARAFGATCSGCGSGIVDATAAVIAATGGGGGGGGTNVSEVEPNNKRSAAQLVSANPATVAGRIASGSDTDYYRVSLAAGATLTATLTPPATADYDLYVYNSSGSQIGSSANGTGSVDSVAVSNGGASATTVYVRVRYYSGTTGTGGDYALGLSQ